jgi:hypothetical protein
MASVDLRYRRLVERLCRGVARIHPEQRRGNDAGRRPHGQRQAHEAEVVGVVEVFGLEVDQSLLVVAGGLDDLRDRLAGHVLRTGADGVLRLLDLGVERGRGAQIRRNISALCLI